MTLTRPSATAPAPRRRLARAERLPQLPGGDSDAGVDPRAPDAPDHASSHRARSHRRLRPDPRRHGRPWPGCPDGCGRRREPVANSRHLVELRPALVKIDAGLISEPSTRMSPGRPGRRSRPFCRGVRSACLAEGSDPRPSRRTVRRLGVTLGQGYHLGRPGRSSCGNGNTVVAPSHVSPTKRRPIARRRRRPCGRRLRHSSRPGHRRPSGLTLLSRGA